MTLVRPEFIRVIQGESRNVPLRIANNDGTPFDLTGWTEIAVAFKRADGTLLTKLASAAGVTVVNLPAGRIAVTLTPADTLALRIADRQNFLVTVTMSPTNIRKVNFDRALNVDRPAVS